MKPSLQPRTSDTRSHTNSLVRAVQSHDSDFEWYPTTQEIIDCIKSDIGDEQFSLLDCGAGDGRVLNGLGAQTKYAIEKSRPLLEAMDRDIFVVGTEFTEQTLIDKAVDFVYSNPPYSEYDAWATKIITEANASAVYLVIPVRWIDSLSIQGAINARGAEHSVLGSFDFLNAERKARAKVDVVKISLRYTRSLRSARLGKRTIDPFDLWFENTFSIETNHTSISDHQRQSNKKEGLESAVSQELVKGGDIVSVLDELYRNEMNELILTYKKLEQIDPDLLSEMDVNLKGVCEALKLKIGGLKDRYWHELFNNFSRITNRLSKHSRERLLSTLTKHTHVDFNPSNAYAIVLWVIKNANSYFDDQLISAVEDLTEMANIQMYKSNMKTFGKEEWRYCRTPSDLDRYMLDYRIVLNRSGGLCQGSFGRSRNDSGLSSRAGVLIDDLCTIASNLGFDTSAYPNAHEFEWDTHVKNVFHCDDTRLSEQLVLFEAKAFKNGNLHFKLNQRFISRLNIEFGRLKGWLKSASEATEETGISLAEAELAFHANHRLGMEGLQLLLCKAVGN